MRRTLFSAIVLFVLTGAALAGEPGAWPIKMPRGTNVILKVPHKAISFEKYNVFGENNSYTVTVDQGPKGLTVGGFPEWKAMGWASQIPVVLNKAEKKAGYLQVEFDVPANGNHIKFRFVPSITDVDAALEVLTFKGTLDEFRASDYYRKELAQMYLPKVFAGPLAGIALDKQLKLFDALKFDSESIGTESFKGKLYMVIRLPPEDLVFNTNLVNQPARVSRTLQRGALTLLKGLNQVVTGDVPEIEGIKMECKIFYRNFNTDEKTGTELMFFYATADQLVKYAESDITNQQLVDNSIVLVNGDRVAVSLTQYD